MPTSVKKNRRKQRRIAKALEIERQRKFINEYPDMLVVLIISILGENK